ncbi:MAG: class I SAM-dependent methyltransferase [Pirellulales bacterium]|nr:class I SAM-dependent methyltransferase [Pirellulales bacterium]
MRENVRAFVELAAQVMPLAAPIYEFGAFQVPGDASGDLRGFFPGRDYVGCDMRPGPGVDRIEDLGHLQLADGSVPTAICVDTLEHVFEARRAVEELIRVLAPGGILLVAVPMEFRVHNHPADYWRFTPACIERLLAPLAASVVVWQGRDKFPHTVFGIGCRAPVATRFAEQAGQLIEAFQGWLDRQEASRPWRQRLKQVLVSPLRSREERNRAGEYYRARFVINLPQPATGEQGGFTGALVDAGQPRMAAPHGVGARARR